LYKEVKAIFKVRYPYNNFLYWKRRLKRQPILDLFVFF
jgi:hypothetical protein